MKLISKSSDDLSESGFRAQLRQAYLPDLVQLECMSRSRRVIRVTTVDAVGYLFFDDGQVIHASIGDLEGEEAAHEILSWSRGTFERCERPWPQRATITKSWQLLLLHAAQAMDERGHGRPSVHSGRPQPGGREATVEQSELVPTPKGAALGKAPSTVLRLDVRGTIVSNHGASEEYAALVSSAFRQVEMIGELLGAESFKALECAAGEQRTFISRDGGHLVAVQSTDPHTIAQVRERLGLSS